ncbi:MAG TPA: YhjD/YihY/BrkB family envelope integrity protein [Gaiellaceae bacterium]|nr:YhjD/YihY/BrkB family envelope integrity protein [Gaiellaceae bacterium]
MSDQEPGLVARVKGRLPQPDVWLARLERARRSIPLLDTAVETVERDAEIGGGILAGALAYRLFLFFLPFAFLLVSVLGLVSQTTGATPREISRDVGLVALVTNEVAATADGHYSVWVFVVSLVVLAYATRVLFRSVLIVHALAWERSAAAAKTRWRPFRLFGLALMVELALAILLGAVRGHSFVDDVLALAGFVVLSAANWLCISLLLPHASATWTDLIPGAVFFGVGLLIVNTFNLYILGRLQEQRTSTYGTLGAAAAVLLSLLLIGRLIVGSAVVNATLFDRRARADAAEEAIG